MATGYPKEIILLCDYDEKFICNFCSNILRDPVQALCGHRFCKKCIELQTETGTWKCSQCSAEGDNDTPQSIIDRSGIFPDNAIKRELSKKTTHCINEGCTWTGPFKDYEVHNPMCEFKSVQCQLCNISILHNTLQTHNENECLERKVFCIKCGNDMVFKVLDNHITTCKGKMINCSIPGCSESIGFEQISAHFNQPSHMVWLMNQLSKLQEPIRYDEKIAALQRKLTEFTDDTSFNLKIRQNVERITLSANERFDVKIGTFEGIVSALHRDLDKAITGIEKLENHRRDLQVTIEQSTGKLTSLTKDMLETKIKLTETNLTMHSLNTSYDGTFIWKITDFFKKRADAQQGTTSFNSSPFYSDRFGYKLCLKLYPNGDGMGKGTHLSIFFIVMKGEFDAILKWPFSYRVAFHLINQTGANSDITDSFVTDVTSTSFQRPTTEMNIASGCPLFAQNGILSNGFLKDDNIFLKVVITPKVS
jgi:TNF receptor-associated factor 2